MVKTIGSFLILSVVLTFVGALINAVPVYFLWNWLMPDLFSLPEITFWQGFGLTALIACLFKSGTLTVKND